ncbi:MAG: FtsX-like permease family protein [Telmatospirillum sp.]|nr:FtsX-like permease family protein [Telmatospirillum sp.]
MKYIPLVWSGLWRKRTRTILTFASIVVAFLLFGLLQGVNAAFGVGVQSSRLDRLYVQSRVSFTDPLPMGHLAQIQTVKGIDGISYANWFGGYYQDQKNFVFSYPVEAETYFALYPEIRIPPEQLQALLKTRTGALVGSELARKFGWKIGDKVPLKSQIWTHPDGTSDWVFDIVGIFDWPGDANQSRAFYFNHTYFDEGRAFGKGTVGWYIVHLADVTKGPEVGKAIDALFANSPNETKTQNEKESTQAFLRQFGDINFIVSSIIGAVFFTLLFLTGNTMMQSIRERLPEFAILKTLGFTDGAVLALVLAESLLLCLTAALIGLGLAALMFPYLKAFVGVLSLPLQVVSLGGGLAVLLALVIGGIPALKAKKLVIVDSLRGQ